MQEAAHAFVGLKDFERFAESDGAAEDHGSAKPSTLVLVERLDLVPDGDLVLVVVQGSHFLWKMVRRIVGVLVEIGKGGLPVERAATLLRSGSGEVARLTAPASGLFLDRVFYDGDREDAGVRPATPLRPYGR